MNPFDMIGDEELYQMCRKWSTGTLLNMSEASKRVRNVCRREIIRRQSVKERKLMEEEELKRPIRYDSPVAWQVDMDENWFYEHPKGFRVYMRD